jgi:serine/threonine-protein kinase
VRELLDPLTRAVAATGLADDLLDDLTITWSTGQVAPMATNLAPEALDILRKLGDALTELAQTATPSTASGANAHRELFEGARGAVVLAWAEAVATRRDLVLAPLLSEALRALQPPSRLIRTARARVSGGSLVDGLLCLPLAGDPAWMFEPEHRAARARTELLVFEAASRALSLPALGNWIFQNPELFDRLISANSRNTLRHRVFAASLLLISADGFPPNSPRAAATARAVKYLASHPEPAVWIPATLALGRLAVKNNDVRGLLLLWFHGDALGEKRRAITALCACAGLDAWSLDQRLEELIENSTNPWELAAVGPALPYLAVEHRTLFERFVSRMRRADAPVEALYSATRGLLVLAKRGPIDRTSDTLLRGARERALDSSTRATTEAQLYSDIRRRTDFLDGIDADPADPELLLERALSNAVELGTERVARRAETIARTIYPLFDSALTRAAQNTDPETRAQALATLDSAVRAACLGYFVPLANNIELEQEITLVRERMFERVTTAVYASKGDFPLTRALLRALGLLLDARGDGKQSLRAAQTLATIDAVEIAKKDEGRLRKTIADVLWRVVDVTRPETIVVPDTVIYSRFAAWCALFAKSSLLLDSLSRSEAAARAPGSRSVDDAVRALRARLDPKKPGAIEGAWAEDVLAALASLGFGETALAESVASLASALEALARARASLESSQLAHAVIALGEAASLLDALLADPALALGAPGNGTWPTDQYRDLAAETVQALFDRDPKISELSVRWAAGLGPVLGPITRAAINALLKNRVEPSMSSRPPEKIGSYRLAERLGRGAQGEAWLVEHERTARRFVMKLLPERALTSRTAEERAELEEAIAREGELLKSIYHPNVANFVDYGIAGDRCYLILEYLIGCDLGDYLEARTLTVAELKPIVADVAAGLAAISNLGLIHGDLKPGNIFLRLALPAENPRFAASLHRDPQHAPLLNAVVIDLGVARTLAGGEMVRDVSGTPGYLAPEQAHGKAHPKTDVYSLAATIYRSLTGRTFFSHLTELGARVFAHASRQPFDDPETLASLPGNISPELIELLREATVMDPNSRPTALELARRFQLY